jgi:hypothetical protein
MENEPPQEYMDYVKMIAVEERENRAINATISVGPFTAFCMISALQLATRHPNLTGSIKTQIRSVVHQLKPLFAGSPVEEIIDRGDHPEWDVDLSTTVPCAKCGTLLDKAKLPPEVKAIGYVSVLCRPCLDGLMREHENIRLVDGGEDASG